MKDWKNFSLKKQIPPHELEKKVAELRSLGKTIATLNGSFDLLHAGHLYMLFEASKVADVLILAVNSDLSIKGYKSPTRPIIPLADRLALLTAISFVDYVTWFDELNPCAILEKIKPDVHVNGKEYGENCVEAEVVRKYGRLHLVDRIEGLSTSAIIENIRKEIT